MQNMNESDHRPTTPMSLDRAREIVTHAEDEFATDGDIEDAFMPFEVQPRGQIFNDDN